MCCGGSAYSGRRHLSKVVIKLTLPAAIISSFVGKEIKPAMLIVML